MKQRLYKKLAGILAAIENCKQSGNKEWEDKHTELLLEMCRNYLPSGSGIDQGSRLDMNKSTSEKLVFHFDYHHMDDSGGYTRWTSHIVTVKPSLWKDIDIYITKGGVRDGSFMDYLYEVWDVALNEEVE